MGRSPCCSKDGMNKGAWTAEEDQILKHYIKTHGEGKWRNLPNQAGLKRCGKSCRLRWLNYLRPNIKRGNITEEEEDLIIRLHKLLGNRWSLIAGRLPGRTDNEIKNYWNTSLSKKVKCPNNITSYNHKSSKENSSKPYNLKTQLATSTTSHDNNYFQVVQNPQGCEKIAVNINVTSTHGEKVSGARVHNFLPILEIYNFDNMEEFLQSDNYNISDSDHDFLKLCNVDHDHQFGLDDQALIHVGDVASDGHRLASSSCQPVLFSQETLMEHWSDHFRNA